MAEEIWGETHYEKKMKIIKEAIDMYLKNLANQFPEKFYYYTEKFSNPCLYTNNKIKFLFWKIDIYDKEAISYYCFDEKRIIKIYVHSAQNLGYAKALVDDIETLAKNHDRTFKVILSKEYY